MSNKQSMGSRRGSHNMRTIRTCDIGTLDTDIIHTPYELMRQRNCKTEKVMQWERYASIRPPVSKCSNDQTRNYLSESVDQGGCLDPSTRGQDAVRIWQLSPHKSNLKFYGVADGLKLPEAVKFNRTLTTSLKHANGSRRPAPKPPVPPEPKRPPQPVSLCQPYILNQQTLKEELQRMPIARQKLNPKEAFSTLFCEKREDPMDPLGVMAATNQIISLREALDMAKPEIPPKHGLRRKHWYCPSKCGEPENKCTVFEWARYKLNPQPYDKAFFKWFQDQKVQLEREPHDYDELYKRFQACFEEKPQPDPECVAMAKCCPDMIKETKDECGVGGGGTGSGGGAHNTEEGNGQPGSGVSGPEGVPQAGKDKEKEKEKVKKSGDLGDTEKDKETDKSKNTGKDNEKNKEDKEKEKDKGKDKVQDKDKVKDKDKDADTDKGKDTDEDKGKNKAKDKGKSKEDKNNDTDHNKKKKNVADPDQEHMKPKHPGKQPKPPIENTTDTSTRDLSSFVSRDSGKISNQGDIIKQEGDPSAKDGVEDKPTQPSSTKPHNKKPASKKPPKGKTGEEKPQKADEKEVKESCPPCPPVGCACTICDCLYGTKIPISPKMQSIMAEEKLREKREYLRRMRHRAYMECTGEKPLVPQHKVDPISCDNCFCLNPKISEYCECLGALQHLQRLLGKERHRIVNNELIFNLDDLRQRIANRMCKCF
ncbi:mediator of RNA polymerase II transcription subunit 1.1 [Drosophila mauritiana]|uniref:Mediator of RNA polymerase II transcription subunit 1.1 n=1 Tax=Drosophila mauritiana TaxID=7226 RepID=A0A6P8KXV2_DROMA|nr:mediator of RNA polymerase II transcription subunit 1.1 [Drosophila mauritiana]